MATPVARGRVHTIAGFGQVLRNIKILSILLSI